MIAIVVLARRRGVNPDNVASPIAGMLGDFCTLGILSIVAHCFYVTREEYEWVQWAVMAGYALLAIVFGRSAFRNSATSKVLVEGWTPVVASMLLSSLGGLILKFAIQRYHLLAPFAPVMNGAGGNLAAVQACRLSTDLHSNGSPGVMPIRRVSFKTTTNSEEPGLEEPLTPQATFSGLF